MNHIFASGTIIDGRYELLELIGEGGNGVVYRARELELERDIAIKFLHSGLIGDSDNLARFKREGSILAELHHPNILKCYRFGIWNAAVPYIAMELLSGQPLNLLIPLSVERSIEVARQICRAMQFAHDRQIIHRDLKPANVFIDSESQDAKILDFGLARLLTTGDNPSQHLTQTGTLLGSTFYMSPEQCMGKKADARSDVYSLGCILYEMIAGKPPLVADTPIGLMHLHVNSMPEQLGSKANAESIPGRLNEAVMRSLRKQPDERFHSMAEFETALMLASVDPAGPPHSEQPAARKELARPRLALIGISLSLLCGLLCACFMKIQRETALDTSFPTSRSAIKLPTMQADKLAYLEWLRAHESTSSDADVGSAYDRLAALTSNDSESRQYRLKAQARFLSTIKTTSRTGGSNLYALLRLAWQYKRLRNIPTLEALQQVSTECSPYLCKADSEYLARTEATGLLCSGQPDKVVATLTQLPSKAAVDCALLAVASESVSGSEASARWLKELKQSPLASPGSCPSVYSAVGAVALLEADQPMLAKRAISSLPPYVRNILAAMIQTHEKRFAEAKSRLQEECTRATDKAPAMTILLRCSKAAGELNSGRTLLLEIINNAEPSTKEYVFPMLAFHCAYDDPVFAEKLADESVRLVPCRSRYEYLISPAYIRAGKPTKALKFISTITPKSRGRYWFDELQAYNDLQKYDKAQAILETVTDDHWVSKECERACTLMATNKQSQSKQLFFSALSRAKQEEYFLSTQVELVDRYIRFCDRAGDTEAVANLSKLSNQLIPHTHLDLWRDLGMLLGNVDVIEYSLANDIQLRPIDD